MIRWTFAAVRDAVLLAGGLALLAEEALLAPEPRTALVTVAAGMIGLPATFLADRRFAPRSGTTETPASPEASATSTPPPDPPSRS